MTRQTLSFSVENNAVTHLGRNLYSTTPPALAELVANSFDAYATKVYIDFDEDREKIVVADNGKGLSFSELKEKYEKIGQAKQPEKSINSLPERKPMGKKGIGKLAAFSLGNVYSVYSKAVGSDRWISFTLNYEEMKKSNEKYDTESASIEKLPTELSKYDSFSSGFIVVCQELRKPILARTFAFTKKQLSRRFYLNQDDFSIYFNDEEVELKTNSYYRNLDFLIYFGYSSEEIDDLFDSSIKKILYKNDEKTNQYILDEGIKGWIASAGKPKEIENAKHIVVYANGKIADEDILKDKDDARIANQYMVGEIQASELIEKLDDPITSSRQGLDDSIPEIERFIENVDRVRKYFIEQWDVFRKEKAVEKLPDRIKNNESYQKWLNTLSKDQQQLNGRLLALFANKIDAEDEDNFEEVDSMITSIASVINNVETDKLAKALKSESDLSASYNLLSELMTKIAVKEDLSHAEIIKSRLEAIEQLKRLMREGSTLEKAFEEHLANNPWLINPYWNIDKNSIDSDNSLNTQVYHNIRKDDGNFERAFLDILIKVAEEKYPIIVELKKNEPTGHAKVTYSDIYNQIDKYRVALKQKFSELEKVDDTDIKAVFIISEDMGIESGNKIDLKEREVKQLKDINIEILKYNQIVDQSQKMYQDHIKIIREANILPKLEELEKADD